MTNSQNSPAYCVLVNDQRDGVLREIIDHLGLLESGGLGAQQKKIGSETLPCHTLHLNTKYYTCDVPLLSCPSFVRLKSICAAERRSNLAVFAVLFCVTRQQLTEDFLAMVSQYSASLEKAEVKALVLRDDQTDEATTSVNTNDEVLNKFALSRRIEIIKIGRKTTNVVDDDDEEGLVGIPRIVEAIETVCWPNMKLKPNPVKQREHRTRLEKYINSEACADDTAVFDMFPHCADDFAPELASHGVNQMPPEKDKTANIEPTGSDYPDSEDEMAILEWFDKPISEDILNLSNIPPPQNKVTNLQPARENDDDALDINAYICKNMNELRHGNTPRPLMARVDVNEGITYDLLKAISSSCNNNKRGDTKKLPEVPETLLKRRKIRAAQRAAKAKNNLNTIKKAKAKKTEIFKRAEHYLVEYRQKQRQLIALKREAKKVGNYYVPDEPKLAFVVRIKGINKIHPRPRKVLQLLRLRQINNGVFVKLNKATIQMLRIADPFIAWGYPSQKIIRQLVYKRGYAKESGQRIPITDNAIVERNMGKSDVICVEDMIHQIWTVGPHFKQVTNFLWPFKLSNPVGGFKKKSNHFVEGGDYGNREDQINKLLEKMI
ncbi:hypothetical protein niasHS_018204 [Heterodera schachtii]|uniref:Large ribosomal subunit protein uL30 n=1 Tax=Heterodera schachtii TaxID=97005 RepID=A0ABD2HPE8_HETSC